MKFQHAAARRRLAPVSQVLNLRAGFNTQPPEGGWAETEAALSTEQVSTRSRPKAAGHFGGQNNTMLIVSTRSRPKAAGSALNTGSACSEVSTRSRPKAAGFFRQLVETCRRVSTRSRPKAAGARWLVSSGRRSSFNTQPPEGGWEPPPPEEPLPPDVSTRSRPKAAGYFCFHPLGFGLVSTRSRPKAAGKRD